MILELPIATTATAFFAVLARLGGFVVALPGLTGDSVPMRIRAALIMGLTLALLPVVPATYLTAAASANLTGNQIALIAGEMTLGAAVGFGARLIAEIVVFAGDLIDRDLGYGMTEILAPGAESPTSVTAGFLTQIFLVLFVVTDGHLGLLRLAGESFHTVAPGSFVAGEGFIDGLLALSGRLLSDGFCLALPVFAVILFSNLVMALMARFGQEFEIMMLSFPVRLGLGLFMLLTMIPLLIHVFNGLGQDVIDWGAWLVQPPS